LAGGGGAGQAAGDESRAPLSGGGAAGVNQSHRVLPFSTVGDVMDGNSFVFILRVFISILTDQNDRCSAS